MAMNLFSMIPTYWPLAGLDAMIGKEAGTVLSGNLVRGDLVGGFKGSLYPEHSLPIQALTAYEQFRAMKGQQVEDGWTGKVKKFLFNITTDPLLMGAVAVAATYSPLHTIAGKVPNYLKNLHKDFGFIQKNLVGMDKLLARKDPTNTLVPLSLIGTLRSQKFNSHFGQQYIDAVTPLWKTGYKENSQIVSMILDGRQNELGSLASKVTKAHLEVATKVRKIFDEMADVLQLPKGARLNTYLPHLFPGVGMNDIIEPDTIEMLKAIKKSRAWSAFAKSVKKEDLPFLNEAELKKLNIPISSFADVVNNRKGVWYEGKVARRIFNQFLVKRTGAQAVEVEGHYVPYTLNLDQIMNAYIRRGARTYGFNKPIENDKLIPDIEQLAPLIVFKGPAPSPAHQNMIRRPILLQLNEIDTKHFMGKLPATHQVYTEYIKSILGHYTDADATLTTMWNNIRLDLHDKLTRTMEVVDTRLPRHRWLKTGLNWLRGPTENMSYPRLQNMITTYTTSAALGLNPRSTVLNMLQTPTTTLNHIGLRGWATGLREAFTRMRSYARTVRSGVSKDDAAQQYFGEYLKYFSENAKGFNLAVLGRDNLDVIASNEKADKFLQKISDFVMLPFSGVERFNHLATFYGSKAVLKDPHILKTAYPGMLKVDPRLREAWADFAASRVVVDTQFAPRPESQLMLLRRGPFGAQPFRQFMSFPLKFGSWIYDSMFKTLWERNEQGQWLTPVPALAKATGGYNFGTIARLGVTGTLMNRFFRDIVGVDLSRGIGGDVVPEGINDQPFAPLPLAPVPSMIFTTMDAVAQGDFKNMKRVLPLMIPGGVHLSRILRMNQQLGSGGRYDEYGRLIQQSNVWDNAMETWVGPLVKSQREYLAIRQTESIRQKVQDIRRRYVLAAARGDTIRMSQLNQEWSEAFPEMPPLTVSSQDFKRAKRSTLETRLQRQIRTSGKLVEGVLDTVTLQDKLQYPWGIMGHGTQDLISGL